MKLTLEQTKKVAKLANLKLSDAQIGEYSEQLSKILDYIDQLSNVNTENTIPTYNVTENTNITQEDKVSKSLTQEQALQNTKNKNNGFFVTKGVFENE